MIVEMPGHWTIVNDMEMSSTPLRIEVSGKRHQCARQGDASATQTSRITGILNPVALESHWVEEQKGTSPISRVWYHIKKKQNKAEDPGNIDRVAGKIASRKARFKFQTPGETSL